VNGPTMDDLRRAGAEAHIARFRAQVEREMRRTWRGRLVWFLVRLYARVRTGR
jgi:hypothetical protein